MESLICISSPEEVIVKPAIYIQIPGRPVYHWQMPSPQSEVKIVTLDKVTLIQQENQGESAARNRGIAAAKQNQGGRGGMHSPLLTRIFSHLSR